MVQSRDFIYRPSWVVLITLSKNYYQLNNKVDLAADKLKLRRTTLIEKMKKYSINSNHNIN